MWESGALDREYQKGTSDGRLVVERIENRMSRRILWHCA